MLRIAMLSKWHVHATDYARVIQGLEDAEITCVWDEDAARGAAWAQEMGVPFEADLDALLRRPDVDAVVVDTPTSMHCEVMCKAAKAGKHIYTEKVLAPTVAACKQVADAVRESGVKFCVSYPHRTKPMMLYAKQVVEQGLLGQINFLRIRNAHGGASQNWLPAYWYIEEDACGGAMMDLGCHPNYQAAYLLGKPVRISAMFNTLCAPGSVEDNAVSVVEFENKAIAVLETGFVTPWSTNSLELLGTDGALIVQDDVVRVRSTHLPMQGWFTPDKLPDALPAAMRQFVDGALYGKEIIFGMDDAIALTQLMENAYISHREQRTVQIPAI